ncbi:uncharacterized protein E0L32_007896 [Thyridium curvatum]|uniref:DUF1446 domain-containing protein n=1 Tax=Thyridium curvatum TaxID=1093900 RepID=A0A507AVG7_9PEZI|nr:uncharacterized protein E0L32_007896 [Thyridium curvatum]TPX11477.1 hypothetical protein E0L32_007896 [Thyridium curvatum]
MADYSSRWDKRGQRPVRIANCSGARGDPGYQMRRQAELGDVDFITGDYLAEMNIADNAAAYHQGKHPGYDPNALQGFRESIDLIARKRIKVIINGGSLNPAGLAEECRKLAIERQLDLKIAFISGDDLYEQIKSDIDSTRVIPAHLDSGNPQVSIKAVVRDFARDPAASSIVSANAYLGARGIVKGLENGADIIICGRVADASPVIGAAWFWHSWSDQDYDNLAHALIAGHLIECCSYITGANYAAFYEVDPEVLIDLPFPIVEIGNDGAAVVCKHANTKGLITVDTVKCQFLYELQGNLYLNSDVTAVLDNVRIESIGTDRVLMTGVRGQPPSPTTKLAIFFQGGFQSQILLNATGYATAEKWAIYEKQIRFGLQKSCVLDDFSCLEFQVVGVNEANPKSQLRSTTYCRIFAQAVSEKPLNMLLKTIQEYGMQHFSGFHLSFDLRTGFPLPFNQYYPALVVQTELKETVNFLGKDGQIYSSIDGGHPPRYQKLGRRDSYETALVADLEIFGPTKRARLGDIVLARSGDKGANLNIGLFVRDADTWPWLQSFMTCARMKALIGDDWCEELFLERVEFKNLHAVHFVIYGILGTGVSSSTRLDSLGKGFADYIRDKVVGIPMKFLKSITVTAVHT